jgi:oligopeptidase A
LYDFTLHYTYNPAKGDQAQQMLEKIRRNTAVIQTPAFNRFQHSFSHIFAGGYAAGYYSYKWAEVLSADAYSQFEERGILDPVTGQAFLKNILEVGGVRDPMESFKAFRGREPSIKPLLKHNGLVES